ncbi:hypothetical protein KM043_005814 [Ampulex compressa]|nr:hypothetical protein KM043_005814 [Ampulex compressa]
MQKPVSESQNFVLRLSGSSTTDDSSGFVMKSNENESNSEDVIVISDSSFSSSPKTSNEPAWKYLLPSDNQKGRKISEVQILDSTDSDYSDSENEKRMYTVRKNYNHRIMSETIRSPMRNIVRKRSSIYTSDDSPIQHNITDDINDTNNSCKSSDTHISPTPRVVQDNANRTKENISKVLGQICRKYRNDKSLSPNPSASGDNSNYNCKKNKDTPCNTHALQDSGTKNKLTRKDANKILKNIKLTRAVYQSPKLQKGENVIIDESIDEDVHPAMLPKINADLKSSSDSEPKTSSENDLIRGSQTSHSDYQDVNNVTSDLSERKKRQISHWLMTNSPDSKSDSSVSHVPTSNRTSVSSGNSSLERLEMNYETPNNRGRISKPGTAKKTILPDSDSMASSVSRQTTMDMYIHLRNSANQYQTPRQSVPRQPSRRRDASGNSYATAQETPQNIGPMDCADILDKLYGNTWRDKANILLPTSEPRKQPIATKNRVIQTERKKKNDRNYHMSESEDDDFNIFSQNIKPHHNSTKKIASRVTRQKDSFINDSSSSDSGADSVYHTALTNPKILTLSPISKATPLSTTTKRAIAICDTDTDSRSEKSSTSNEQDLEQRKLSFSDDESDTDTSEFDPGDHIPPKPIFKKGVTKVPGARTKIPTKLPAPTFNNHTYTKYNSFLASLSENIPINVAHPDAKKYRLNYKNNKEELCRYLFKLYNEKVFDKQLPMDMSIEWNVRMRGTAGFCYNKKSIKSLGGIVKSSRIVLATKILDTPDRVRDTLIHEMCHAAAWLINNVSDGHGPFWTGWAKKAMNTFPELPPIRRCHDYKIKTKFTYRCTSCGYSIGRHSKSLDVEKKRCGHCYGKFELLINKTTKSGTVQMQTPNRGPSAFALYVKENYNSVKKERNIKHAEIMKLLGIGTYNILCKRLLYMRK